MDQAVQWMDAQDGPLRTKLYGMYLSVYGMKSKRGCAYFLTHPPLFTNHEICILEFEAQRSHNLTAVVGNLRRAGSFNTTCCTIKLVVASIVVCIEVTVLHLVLIGQVNVATFVAIADTESDAVDIFPVGIVCLCVGTVIIQVVIGIILERGRNEIVS